MVFNVKINIKLFKFCFHLNIYKKKNFQNLKMQLNYNFFVNVIIINICFFNKIQHKLPQKNHSLKNSSMKKEFD